MLYFWSCLHDQHEQRLVLLAVLLCMVGSLASVLLIRQTRDSRNAHTQMQGARRWLALAALVTGFSIWATHFVAMLGYLPGFVTGYRVIPTVGSLGLAVAAVWLGLWLALRRGDATMRALAACVIGGGVAGMHYTGMLAVNLPARITWQPVYVIVSLLFAVAPLYPALGLALRGHGHRTSLKAASLVTLSSVLLHFTGMAAIRLQPANDVASQGAMLSPGWMAAVIAGAALVVVVNGLVVLAASRSSRAALHASERDFAMLAKGISDCAIYMLTLQGRIANWNTGAQRLKGYEEAEVIGKPLAIFYTQADLAAGVPDTALGIAAQTGKFTGEGWRRRKDGSAFWAHVTIEKVSDAAGQPIGFAKITRDMTRLKQDQDRLARLTAHLDTALDNMHQGLCLLDGEHRLVLHNRRFAQLWRLEKDLPEGTSLADLASRALAARLPGAAGLTDMLRNAILNGGDEAAIGEFDETLILSIASSALPDGGLVATFEDITERRRSEARITWLATHDALTGLPNRSRFHAWTTAEMLRAHGAARSFAMVAFDLDRFKEVNDLLGQSQGDAVIVELATRLQQALGEGEMVARLAGDEFGAGMSFAEEGELHGFVARLSACFDRALDIGPAPFTVSASFGIAIAPQDAGTPEALLGNANLAMQRAKASPASSISYYEQGMDEAARARRQIAAGLRMAVVRDEFRLLYQPQHRISTGELKGYEALIRWDHGELGVIGPDRFIPLAEESGEILAIGQWVLRRACSDAALWNNDLTVAVNLSPVQLMQPDLVRMVAQILIDSGLPAQRLELEITESAIIADKARALHVLRQIKALGISIAMDDFGTGFASLDSLHAFPFDKIKIDKSFLLQSGGSHQAASIIRAVVALGKNLDIPVLAEGVETIEQLALLAREGCDEGQGYYYGAPMDLRGELPRLVANV
jgi:diguanylate cyclase (GGDEF)-like protein/PAS domain S-box-containing protein